MGIVVFILVAILFLLAVARGGGSDSGSSGPESASRRSEGSVVRMPWDDSDAETVWEEIIQASGRLSLAPRTRDVDASQAENQLEAFGTRCMPNAYATYQKVRAEALEVEELVKKNFPKGRASDPTGGTLFAKAEKKLAEAVARTFRRRDELCFFLLFRQAGIFGEDKLAEYDAHPVSIRLEEESTSWPDDTPKADTALSGEDAAFAARFLPETHAGYQRLCGLFDEGAVQYAELRRTALALDAPRAHREFGLLKTRLEMIRKTLQQHQADIAAQRLAHAFGETTAEHLGEVDREKNESIREFERKMAVKAVYDAQVAEVTQSLTLPGGAEMEMVWCPPGTFMMGSPSTEGGVGDHETKHQVTLTKGFWMAKYPVTQKQWTSVMGTTIHEKYAEELEAVKAYRKRAKAAGACVGPLPDLPGTGDDYPMCCVSWSDAHAFCRKAGLRLPTEAEWEYACRAGTTGPFGGTGRLADMGWYEDNSGERTHPVGMKQPNAWGLCDCHGNVEEWCADWCDWEYYAKSPAVDPQGPSDGFARVQRGGSWRDGEFCCRSAHRTSSTGSSVIFGFRPCCSGEPG